MHTILWIISTTMKAPVSWRKVFSDSSVDSVASGLTPKKTLMQ